MVHCAIGICTNDSHLNHNVSFYSFPNKSTKLSCQRRKKWIHACGRKYTFQPSKWSVICDNHFVAGVPENNPLSSSWIPTLNLGNFFWKSLSPKKVCIYNYICRIYTDSVEIDACLFPEICTECNKVIFMSVSEKASYLI